MWQQLSAIGQFMVEALAHTWPYLLVTIPLAVVVKLSGASKYIQRAFQAGPIVAIFLATIVGAFSPFCSCGVIPVVATLLIGGVPLAPVMSFWLASPSMDPETFFLSVSLVGWELAVWRLAATLGMSLGAGLITYALTQSGWLKAGVLRQDYRVDAPSTGQVLREAWRNLRPRLEPAPQPLLLAYTPSAMTISLGVIAAAPTPAPEPTEGSSCAVPAQPSFAQKLGQETLNATWMVLKFMTLAFFLEALITLYVPTEWITAVLGGKSGWTVFAAALLGVPIYTSNLAALPMVGGLLAQGMNPAAALAFLVAGPTTTIPAMAAVWGLVSRRVFALYILFALLGAIVAGLAYLLVLG